MTLCGHIELLSLTAVLIYQIILNTSLYSDYDKDDLVNREVQYCPGVFHTHIFRLHYTVVQLQSTMHRTIDLEDFSSNKNEVYFPNMGFSWRVSIVVNP